MALTMRKVFWDNPYQQRLNTHVSQIKDNRILFAETIAFSFSGGQESDEAYVNGLAIIDSEIEDNFIYYTLSSGHGLFPGDPVVMEINWDRRYRLMRLHFAAELILELVSRDLKIEKIGAHITETKARIDFIYVKNISHIFDSILMQYNKIIEMDAIIKTGFTDIKQQRRFWEIEGFSKVDCGGTHVQSTAEVGEVTLKRVNIGNGKERIEIRLVR